MPWPTWSAGGVRRSVSSRDGSGSEPPIRSGAPLCGPQRRETAFWSHRSCMSSRIWRRGCFGFSTRARSGPDISICCPVLTRSEEHTSELQSLMRISYAVFCLKKKQLFNFTLYLSIYSHHFNNLYCTKRQPYIKPIYPLFQLTAI